MLPAEFSRYAPSDAAQAKIALLARGGLDAVVAGFDRTITESGSATSASILRDLIRIGRPDLVAPLDESYMAETDALFARYHPVESDVARPISERVDACERWWSAHFRLLAGYGLGSHVFERAFLDATVRGLLVPRAGLIRLMRATSDDGILFVVFSAGIGNAISAWLSVGGLLADSVRIVANVLEFGSDGIFRGRLRNRELIHTFSKNECHMDGLGRPIADRYRILLFGDSVGDAAMVEDRPDRTVLRVGICESADPMVGSAYSGVFDVVLSPSEVDRFCEAVITRLLPSTRKTED